MYKGRLRFIITFMFLVFSVTLNIYLFNNRHEEIENITETISDSECHLYPTNQCLIDFPAETETFANLYKAYSISGDNIIFMDFKLSGSITNSIKDKYGIEPDAKLIRNIQHLAFFFLDFKISFRDGDKISLFYRDADSKIVYMRYKNRSKKSIYEAFLTETNGKEIYLSQTGAYIEPCIENGPFIGCPQTKLTMLNGNLQPVFIVSPHSEIKTPFDATVIAVNSNNRTGGSVELYYEKYHKTAFFGYIGNISSLISVGKRIKEGTIIGYSGFDKEKKYDGIIYYLKGQDAVTSPFLFHHLERKSIKENDMVNLSITKSFYRRWLQRGLNYEKLF